MMSQSGVIFLFVLYFKFFRIVSDIILYIWIFCIKFRNIFKTIGFPVCLYIFFRSKYIYSYLVWIAVFIKRKAYTVEIIVKDMLYNFFGASIVVGCSILINDDSNIQFVPVICSCIMRRDDIHFCMLF